MILLSFPWSFFSRFSMASNSWNLAWCVDQMVALPEWEKAVVDRRVDLEGEVVVVESCEEFVEFGKS